MEVTQEPIDRSVLERLGKQGGSELKVKTIEQFLEKISSRMEAACDRGRAGDLYAVENAIHSIKTAAGNVGAFELSNFADRIERAAFVGARDLVIPLLCQLNDMVDQVETWLQRERASLLSSRGINWN